MFLIPRAFIPRTEVIIMESLEETVTTIPVGEVELEAILEVPEDATGIVIFAQGTVSNRLSPRTNYMAEEIREKKLGTLLFDLLTPAEHTIRANRFDIPLLAERLIGVTLWVQAQKKLEDLKIGYFGASTGAAAAMGGVAHFGEEISAFVSQGGRVDMATRVINMIRTPTLLIVGSKDRTVLELNSGVYQALSCKKALEVVEGASHLFQEPGKLKEATLLTREWFAEHLS